MKRTGWWLAAACAVGLGLGMAAVFAGAPTDGAPLRRGLVAHYYTDPEEWNGQWLRQWDLPKDDPKNWTFTEYRYSRVEPLINHLFINRGWFSVRWTGWFDPAPGAHAQGEQEYVFEIWSDDGARLILNGKTLIDDWQARWEDSPEAWRRSRPVRLAPGRHRIVVEYFQGLSEGDGDHDPMKLYWSLPSRKLKRQIVPAAHFSHGDADLRPDPAGQRPTPP